MVNDEVCSVQSPSRSSDKFTTDSPSKSGDRFWTSESETQSSGTPSETDRLHHGAGDEDEEAEANSDQDMANSDTETSSNTSGVAVKLAKLRR